MPSERLDQALVARGLAESRTRARQMVEAGVVRIDGRPARKPSEGVSADAEVRIEGDPMPWVSRGAVKLLAALDAFDIAVSGRVAVDIGASTGGFTEVLLSRGATLVHAVDVGRGQLHTRIAGDARVRDMAGTDARNLVRLDPQPDLLVADVSFISVTKALAGPLGLLAGSADAVVLVKPQFEAGPERVGKGGIVRDDAVRQGTCTLVRRFLEDQGWDTSDPVESPIEGGDGNREFLLHGRRG